MATQSSNGKQVDLMMLVRACVLLVVGILFCISPVMGTKALSLILGIALIVLGVVFVTLAIVKEKSLIVPWALIGFLAISLGIYGIIVNAIGRIAGFVPYVLIPFGVLLVADAFMGRFWRKEKSTFLFIVKLVLGIAGLALGICLLTIESFKTYASVVLGAAIIALSIGIFVKGIKN